MTLLVTFKGSSSDVLVAVFFVAEELEGAVEELEEGALPLLD